jgi:hypothetical protein
MLIKQQRKWPGIASLSGLRSSRRHGRRSLGCSACGPKGLGQIEDDPYYTGDYITNTAPLVNVDSPSYGGGTVYSAFGTEEFGSAPASSGGAYPGVPNLTPQENYVTYKPTTSIPTVPGIPQIPGLASIGTSVPTQPGTAPSSLSSIAPLAALGLGGIALIAVLKRR